MVFPDDYRQYLLHVSAGGRVRTSQVDQGRWHWDGDRITDRATPHVPFPDHDTALAASEDLWLTEPQLGDYTSAEAYRADHDAWSESADAADAAECARTSGTVPLSDDGCGFHTLLVVSGPMRGAVWFDGRASCDRLNPLLNDDGQPATFAEWYLDWLTQPPLADRCPRKYCGLHRRGRLRRHRPRRGAHPPTDPVGWGIRHLFRYFS